jgi:hypothetical protein
VNARTPNARSVEGQLQGERARPADNDRVRFRADALRNETDGRAHAKSLERESQYVHRIEAPAVVPRNCDCLAAIDRDIKRWRVHAFRGRVLRSTMQQSAGEEAKR